VFLLNLGMSSPPDLTIEVTQLFVKLPMVDTNLVSPLQLPNLSLTYALKYENPGHRRITHQGQNHQ
jgi:hypothetical protein